MPVKTSRNKKSVVVLPNPWHSIDHEGRPAGHCPRERTNPTPGHQGHVCCSMVAQLGPALPDGHQGTRDQDTCWHFSKEPQSFDDPNDFYKNALRNGEIFPADERTAKYAGVEFKPFDKLLEESRAEANKKWKGVTGENLPDTDPFAKPVPLGAEPDPIPAQASPLSKKEKP